MIYSTLFVGSLAVASGFQAGASAGRFSQLSRSKVSMQVTAEPLVAEPTVLAKAADEARGLAIDSIS